MHRLSKFLYQLSHRARMNWYGGHYALAQFLAPPSTLPIPAPGSLPGWSYIKRDLETLLRQDWARISDGRYRAPADTLPNPVRLAKQSLSYLRDLPAINQRKRRRLSDEAVPHEGEIDYPDYFLQNFHFQSGGWFGKDSADLYDFQVEVLFIGGADAMRRQLLSPLGAILAEETTRPRSLVDIASGTGRFLREVRRNWPALALTGIDLSPDYLTHAESRNKGPSSISYLQGKAEDLPLGDESRDFVTCIYLFHELPADIRRQAAAEFYRVLRPGGWLLFMDSIQLGDHGAYDALLDRFPAAFHEPYYRDFIRCDLKTLFHDQGFMLRSRERAFFSMAWMLQKPAV